MPIPNALRTVVSDPNAPAYELRDPQVLARGGGEGVTLVEASRAAKPGRVGDLSLIDYHASQVAWNDEMHSVVPGEVLIYEFTTDYAGVWMYHCDADRGSTSPTASSAFIVEPEGGLPPIDQEQWYFYAVQLNPVRNSTMPTG